MYIRLQLWTILETLGRNCCKKQMIGKIESKDKTFIYMIYDMCTKVVQFMNKLARPWENMCVIQEPMPSNWPGSKTFLDPGKYVRYCELWSSKNQRKWPWGSSRYILWFLFVEHLGQACCDHNDVLQPISINNIQIPLPTVLQPLLKSENWPRPKIDCQKSLRRWICGSPWRDTHLLWQSLNGISLAFEWMSERKSFFVNDCKPILHPAQPRWCW